MKSEIHIIAEAILANTQVLKMLVEKLPAAVAEKVAEKVEAAQVTPAPVVVTTVPAAESPVTVPVTVTVTPVVEAAPEQEVVAKYEQTQVKVDLIIPPEKKKVCPFVDQKGLITYVMDAYKQMGQTKGAAIQGVMDRVGIKNINEVKPEMYQAFWEGVEELRNV